MGFAIDHSTPVVILRSGHHGGVGAARSLGRLGVPVYIVDGDRWEAGFSSRYCRQRFVINTEMQPVEAVARMVEIGHKLGGRPILIPTTDQATIWVSGHASALREAYTFPSQDPQLTRVLCDKSRMQDLARRNGVATAQAVVPTSKMILENFLETAIFPVMVKAIDAESFRRLNGSTKVLVPTLEELLALYKKTKNPEQPGYLVQEFIPGDDWMFNGYFDEASECLFEATGKKLRRFPVDTGVTSLGICLRNPELSRITTKFMKDIGYRGILDIGFRRDERDGTYKVLDVNPRVGCTFRLFTGLNGMDVVRAFYLDATGQALPISEAAEGRKWVVEDFDLFSAFRLTMTHRLAISQWFRSLRGVQETACFAWDDPLPLLMMGVTDCFQFWRWISAGPRGVSRRLDQDASISSSAL